MDALRLRLALVAIAGSPVLLGFWLSAVGFCHDQPPPETLFGLSRWVENLRYRASGLHDWRLQLCVASAVHLLSSFGEVSARRRWPRALGGGVAPLSAAASLALYGYSAILTATQPQAIAWEIKPAYFDASLTVLWMGLFREYIALRQRWTVEPGSTLRLSGWTGALAVITFVMTFVFVLDGDWFIVDQALTRAASVAVLACPPLFEEEARAAGLPSPERGWAVRFFGMTTASCVYHALFIPLAMAGVLSPFVASATAVAWLALQATRFRVLRVREKKSPREEGKRRV